MLLHIPGVLDAQQLAEFNTQLAQAGEAWVDGRVTAGQVLELPAGEGAGR